MTESLQNEISVASTDYAKYFDFSSLHSSQHGAVHETIEQLLTELDELNALVQTVQTNLNSTHQQLAPLSSQVKQLEKTFLFIDMLEEFIRNMDGMVTQAEEKVTTIENNNNMLLQSSIALSQKAKSLFSSFSFGKKKPEQEQKEPEPSPIQPVTPLQVLDTQEILQQIKSSFKEEKQ